MATTGRQTKKYAGKLVPEYKRILDVQQLEGKNIDALKRLDWIEQSFTADNVEIQPGTTRVLKTPQCKGEAAGGVEVGCIHRVRVKAEEEGADSRRGERDQDQEEERGKVTSGGPAEKGEIKRHLLFVEVGLGLDPSRILGRSAEGPTSCGRSSGAGPCSGCCGETQNASQNPSIIFDVDALVRP